MNVIMSNLYSGVDQSTKFEIVYLEADPQENLNVNYLILCRIVYEDGNVETLQEWWLKDVKKADALYEKKCKQMCEFLE